MSAEQVQAALVRLVRYPAFHRGEEVDAFVAQYELDAREALQVRALASSFYVRKFGLAERRVRFRTSVRDPPPVTVGVLGEAAAERLFAERFEPAHPVLGVAEIGGAFVRWFLGAFSALRAESELPPWLADVVRYEFAAFTTFGELLQRTWCVPDGSVLRADAPFTIAALSYDVDAYVEEASDLPEGVLPERSPPLRPTLMLFARIPRGRPDGERYGCRCVVDESVRAFLEAQRDGRLDVARPASYATLVKLGLCNGG